MTEQNKLSNQEWNESTFELNRESLLLAPYSFENFEKAESNQVALDVCIQVANNLGELASSTYIYSKSGGGKTHLIQAIGKDICQNSEGIKVIYIRAHTFVEQLVSALQDNTMSEFKSHYHSVDVLMLDDFSFFEGKPRIQEEFLHIFNKMKDKNKLIILSADKPFNHLDISDKFKSRIAAGLILEIESPEFELRKAFIKQKLSEKQKDLPENVITYLADYITKDFRNLEGALDNMFIKGKLTGCLVNLENTKNIVSGYT